LPWGIKTRKADRALFQWLLFHFQIKALSSLARRRLLNVLPVRLRRLLPRRLDIIFDLKPELPNLLQQQGSVCPEVVVCSTYVHLEEVEQEKADVRRKNSLYGRKARKYSMFCFFIKHKTI